MAKKPKTVPLSPLSPYRQGTRFLVLPAEVKAELLPCWAAVTALESNGAWLELQQEGQGFPRQEEVVLVEYRERWIITHRTRILKRQGGQVWVDCPSLTRQEESSLALFTGRQDFRVEANLPVLIVLQDDMQHVMPRSGLLSDMSRGGMGLVVPVNDIYTRGQQVEVQLVSWSYPVNVQTTVNRVWVDGDKKRLALIFPKTMSSSQRDVVSAFIIDVQRKQAQSSLPATLDESP